MRLSPYLRNGFIRLEMKTCIEPPETQEQDHDGYVRRVKESVIEEIAELLDETGRVGNRRKIFLDLWNREKKASTAIGHGIAIPHIRSKQIKGVVLGFARSADGVEFDAPDGEKVHFFIVVVGSSFDPELYLKVCKEVVEMFRYDSVRQQLYETWSESDVYRMFDGNY